MANKIRKDFSSGADRSISLKTYDEAVSLLAHIRTLASLLEALGIPKNAEPIDAGLASMTGSLMMREVDQLHHLLKSSLKKKPK